MTTNVTIHNAPGHQNIKIFRRHEDGTEDALLELGSGHTSKYHHLYVYEGCEIVIREVPVNQESHDVL